MGEEIKQIAQELPEYKKHDQVGAGDHAQQHTGSEPDQGEIPVFMGVLMHVPDRIGVDDRPNGGDQDHHDRAEPVDVEAQAHGERSQGCRVVKPNCDRTLCRDDVEHGDGAAKRRSHRPCREPRARLPRADAARHDDHRRKQGQERNEDHEGHGCVIPINGDPPSKQKKPTGVLEKPPRSRRLACTVAGPLNREPATLLALALLSVI